VITDADGKARLVISSKTTGSAGGFTVDTSAMPGNELSADAAYLRAGPTLDAQYELDGSGTVLSSTTNVIENAIPGVRMTLKGVTSSAVSVTASAPDVERTAVKGKIKAFVDAYNTLLTNLDAKTTQKPVAKPTSTSDAQQGALYGDTGLASLASQLRQFASQTLSGVPGVTSLADLGITVPKATGAAATDDAKLGKLSVDDTVLTTALDNDWTKVSSFFDSFAVKADDFVRGYTGTSKSILDGRVKSADADVASFNTQIDDMNLRLTSQETRLRSQFAAMESALSKSQSQSQWLAGQISHLG
jgi:flagellar hook-associated protein 2